MIQRMKTFFREVIEEAKERERRAQMQTKRSWLEFFGWRQTIEE